MHPVTPESAQDGGYSPLEIRDRLRAGELFMVNARRKNGLILCKSYYAEFAGPGAAVGSWFDLNVVDIIAVGNLALSPATTPQEKVNAYLLRRQWVRLAKQITDNPLAIERAQVILNQFEHWFDAQTISQLPDEVFALLVGVLPQTIRKVRDRVERLEI